MKTKRFFIFGLPVVLLALGLIVSASLTLAGCSTDSDDSGTKEAGGGGDDETEEAGGGQPGRLTVKNLTGEAQYAQILSNVSPAPTTQAQINEILPTLEDVAFDGYDEDHQAPFDMRMMEGGEAVVFNKTGKYLVVVSGSAGRKFKTDVQFTNGSATVDYNTMTLISSLPEG
jgi:hypothetical protein